MTGGELAAFIFYALMMAGAVATISEVYGELQRAVGATERLLELLSVESLIPYQSGTDMFPASNASVIQFDGVTFSYPARPQVKALDQVSFSIREGERVALVGPSGAGKSTIFELLQRFYDSNEGCVSVFGQSVHDVSTEALRKRLGIVSQQPVMFSSTIKHNIAYGNEDASQKDIEAAALAAHAHEFIEALPKGYDSYLGEQGTRLSGGQKQRVAIARAVLKDPDILLLDEATSALDSESEYHVQQAIDELTENRTTLIIAHRLSTIKHVDRILVFDQGQIVAQGTHDQLLASSELYSRLAKLQFMDA